MPNCSPPSAINLKMKSSAMSASFTRIVTFAAHESNRGRCRMMRPFVLGITTGRESTS